MAYMESSLWGLLVTPDFPDVETEARERKGIDQVTQLGSGEARAS